MPTDSMIVGPELLAFTVGGTEMFPLVGPDSAEIKPGAHGITIGSQRQ